jgi:hypothetical protein
MAPRSYFRLLGKVRAMSDSLPWPLQRELWSLERLFWPKRSINGKASKCWCLKAITLLLVHITEACIHYALRKRNAKSNALGYKKWWACICTPFLYLCDARCKCARTLTKRFWISLVTCFTRREFGENAIANATQIIFGLHVVSAISCKRIHAS